MRIATLALVVGVAGVASANTAHHSSGGGGSSTAECIRWEPIPVDMAGADLSIADMTTADLGGAGDLGGRSIVVDGGAPADMRAADPHAGMRCAERAGLFSCAFAPSGGGDAWGGVALFFVAALALSCGGRRERRRG